MESYVGLKTVLTTAALEGPNVHLLHSRRVLHTILIKIMFKKEFPEATNAFSIEIFTSGAISDGIKNLRFSKFLHGRAVANFDGIDAASV